jgi:hypothetical protein
MTNCCVCRLNITLLDWYNTTGWLSLNIQPNASVATAAVCDLLTFYIVEWLMAVCLQNKYEEHDKKQFISRRQTSISGQLITVLNSTKVWRQKFASRELQDLTAYVSNIRTLWQAIVFVFTIIVIQHNSHKRHHAGHVFYYQTISGSHFCSFDFVRYKIATSAH